MSWLSIINTIPRIANLPGQPGPTPGANEIITEIGDNIITEVGGLEMVTENAA